MANIASVSTGRRRRRYALFTDLTAVQKTKGCFQQKCQSSDKFKCSSSAECATTCAKLEGFALSLRFHRGLQLRICEEVVLRRIVNLDPCHSRDREYFVLLFYRLMQRREREKPNPSVTSARSCLFVGAYRTPKLWTVLSRLNRHRIYASGLLESARRDVQHASSFADDHLTFSEF